MDVSVEEAVLRAEALSMEFNSGTPRAVTAFRDVSFELMPRETLAIIGPSGCGKSTLFNVIAGLLEPTGGAVFVSGKRVSDATGHVGYMLQKDLLLPWRSVLDNVILGLEVRGEPVDRARETARRLISAYGLAGFEHAKPAALSGGMRQRAAFMRTLAPDPQVVLLDEPFSALDFQTRIVLQSEVKRIIAERGKSVVLVTHDIGEALTMADRVLVLTHRPGRVRSVHVLDLDRSDPDPIGFRRNPKFQEYFELLWAELEVRAEAIS
jgi:NitT/TauT family transport system ATP-binding protein